MTKEIDVELTSYRTCFSTDAGKRVLTDILCQSGYFDTNLHTEGEVAVQNFAKKIIKKLGIGDTPQKAGEYVHNLFNLRIGK